MTFAPDHALAQVIASPNHGERRREVFALVLHYTGLPSAQAALELLLSPATEVSAHYLVDVDGSILQLVPEARRAWHAGKSFWAGETDMNSASIGVEIQHPGHDDPRSYPKEQIGAVVALAQDVCARHRIKRRHVLGHSDIAISRKIDPGEFFPWDALAAGGVGLAPWTSPPAFGDDAIAPEDAAIADLRRKLAHFGYEVEEGGPLDARLAAVLAAFQRHFRPQRVDGRPDRSTLATLDRLLAEMD